MVNSNMESSLPVSEPAIRPGESQLADPLATLPGYLLRKAANAMMGELAALLAPLELRIIDASVLLLVTDRSDLTSSDIGKALDIQRANMVPVLARLEAAGLIRRQPLDRKSQAILLTATGRSWLREVEQVTQAFEAGLLARIPAAHREHFVPALRALIT